MTRNIVVVGAGVVGAAAAAELSGDGHAVTLLDAGSVDRLPGSTGHAPGFVGLLAASPVQTALARHSADVYEQLSWRGRSGFERVGGLEVALSEDGLRVLHHRARTATAAGLPTRELGAAEAARIAPELVDPDRCTGAVLFPADGTARARLVTAALRTRAVAAGATVRDRTAVRAVEVRGGRVTGVVAPDGRIPADDVVVAAGIWGLPLLASAGSAVPVFPVEHPYVHGGPRPARGGRSPFVRWPERYVYARDHGDHLGIGSYDHPPRPVDPYRLTGDAEAPWPAEYDAVVAEALALLPAAARPTVDRRLNGLFSMTPDDLPLVGPLPGVDGLWCAEAIWVTHAAGAARVLADRISGRSTGLVDPDALRPDRFGDRPYEELRASAMRHYNDIYGLTAASGAASP